VGEDAVVPAGPQPAQRDAIHQTSLLPVVRTGAVGARPRKPVR